MNLSTILHLFQRPTAILLILMTAVFGTPLPLFAQNQPPVPTNETGALTPTQTLEEANNNTEDSASEPPSPQTGPLAPAVPQAANPLSPVMDMTGNEQKNRTERSSVVDEDGNRVETTQKYENGILKRETTRTFSKEGDLSARAREKFAKSGRSLSKTMTEYDADGNKVSQERDKFSYGNKGDQIADQVVCVLEDWTGGKKSSTKTTIQFDAEGDPTGATQVLSDGTKMTYGQGDLEYLQGSSADEMVLEGDQKLLWENEAEDGSWKAVIASGEGSDHFVQPQEPVTTYDDQNRPTKVIHTDGSQTLYSYGDDFTTTIEVDAEGGYTSAKRVFADGTVEIYGDLQTQAEVFQLIPNSTTLWSQGRGTKTAPTLPISIIGFLQETQHPDGTKTLYFYGEDGSKTALELDKDGNLTGATKTLSDGTVQTFDHLEKLLMRQTTCDANGQNCSVLMSQLIEDPNRVFLGSQTVTAILPDGSKQTSVYSFTGYLAQVQNPTGTQPATAQLLDQAKQILGDAVASGTTTPAPENLPDAGSTTIFYDADGNIVGKLLSGFFPPPGEPDMIWYSYENGEYSKISGENLALPEGSAQSIADYLNIDPSSIISATYMQKNDTMFCMGTGCASWTGSLEVSATINGEEKHFVGTITGGFFDQPDRAPEVTLQEVVPATTDLLDQAKQVLGDAVVSGQTTLAPWNLPDAGNTTIFYDGNGNIVGKLLSGFFPPPGMPDTKWYKYENGQYVEISQESVTPTNVVTSLPTNAEYLKDITAPQGTLKFYSVGEKLYVVNQNTGIVQMYDFNPTGSTPIAALSDTTLQPAIRSEFVQGISPDGKYLILAYPTWSLDNFAPSGGRSYFDFKFAVVPLVSGLGDPVMLHLSYTAALFSADFTSNSSVVLTDWDKNKYSLSVTYGTNTLQAVVTPLGEQPTTPVISAPTVETTATTATIKVAVTDVPQGAEVKLNYQGEALVMTLNPDTGLYELTLTGLNPETAYEYTIFVQDPANATNKLAVTAAPLTFTTLAQPVTPEPVVVQATSVLSQDLIKTYGFTQEMIDQHLADGSIKIKVDLANLTATVTFDPSVTMSASALNMSDLLGFNHLPTEIHYTLGKAEPVQMGVPCTVSSDGTTQCPPQPNPTYYLISGTFAVLDRHYQLSYVEGDISGYKPTWSGDNLLHSVKLSIENPQIVCVAAGCNLQLVKETTYTYTPNETTGIPELTGAHINYLNGFQGMVASRDLVIAKMDDGEYHIQNIRDLNSTGETLAVNEFNHAILIADNFEAGVSQVSVMLDSIIRTDANGKVLSTLTLEGNKATITLADGTSQIVMFETYEELLKLAAKVEGTVQYDDQGRPISVTHEDGSKTLYAYGDNFTTTIEVDAEGGYTSAKRVFTDGTVEIYGDLQVQTEVFQLIPNSTSLWSQGRGTKEAPTLPMEIIGFLQETQHPDGSKTLYSYGEDGSKTSIEMDKDGNLTGATKTLSDGTVETFDHLEKLLMRQTTCDASGQNCSVLMSQLIEDPNRVFLGSQTVSVVLADGSTQTSIYSFTGYLAKVQNPDGSTVTHIYSQGYDLAVAMAADGTITSAVLTNGQNITLNVTDVYSQLEAEGAAGLDKLIGDLQDLTTRLGISQLDIKLTDFAKVTWTNGCVGWPALACTMALVTDYLVIFEIDGISFEYHAGQLDPNMKDILETVSTVPEADRLQAIKDILAQQAQTTLVTNKQETSQPTTQTFTAQDGSIVVVAYDTQGNIIGAKSTRPDGRVQVFKDVAFQDGTPTINAVQGEMVIWVQKIDGVQKNLVGTYVETIVPAAWTEEAQARLGATVVRAREVFNSMTPSVTNDGTIRFYDAANNLMGVRTLQGAANYPVSWYGINPATGSYDQTTMLFQVNPDGSTSAFSNGMPGGPITSGPTLATTTMVTLSVDGKFINGTPTTVYPDKHYDTYKDAQLVMTQQMTCSADGSNCSTVAGSTASPMTFAKNLMTYTDFKVLADGSYQVTQYAVWARPYLSSYYPSGSPIVGINYSYNTVGTQQTVMTQLSDGTCKYETYGISGALVTSTSGVCSNQVAV